MGDFEKGRWGLNVLEVSVEWEAIKKTRRRIENALRETKDKTIIVAVAKFLGVDDESIRLGKMRKGITIDKLVVLFIQGNILYCYFDYFQLL